MHTNMCLGTRILSTFNFESVSPNTYLLAFPKHRFYGFHPCTKGETPFSKFMCHDDVCSAKYCHFLYSLDADPDGVEVGLGVHHAGADVQHVVGLRFGMLRHPAWQ